MSESALSQSQKRSVSLAEGRRSTRETTDLANVRAKAKRAAPSAEDIRKETGARIEYKDNGDWVAHVPKEKIARGVAMLDGMRRARKDRDLEVQAVSRKDYEKVVRPDGKVVKVAPNALEQMKDKKHLRPVGRNGVSSTLFYGLSEATKRYVQGPDKLCFIWNEGWEPVTLFSNGAEGEQRDPDGNVWVKDDAGEWIPKEV